VSLLSGLALIPLSLPTPTPARLSHYSLVRRRGRVLIPLGAWVLSGALAFIAKMEKTRRVGIRGTNPPGLDYSAGGVFTDVQAV
jgi:hypothetical protein